MRHKQYFVGYLRLKMAIKRLNITFETKKNHDHVPGIGFETIFLHNNFEIIVKECIKLDHDHK